MHAHLEVPRAPQNSGELYRWKTVFLDDFPIFLYPNGTWTHPLPIFLDFLKLCRATKTSDSLRQIFNMSNIGEHGAR